MQNINLLMPTGDGSIFCKQLLNESQMLLHTNAVNLLREGNGLLPANSLWLWGEGALTEPTTKTILSKCYGNDVLLKGISNYLGVPHEKVTTASSLIAQLEKSECDIVVFDELLSACSYGDTSSWLTSFESLYETLLKPFLDFALKNNIEIHCYPCNGYRYVINSKTKFRFWRRAGMESYFEPNH